MTKDETLQFIKENAVEFNKRLYLNMMGKPILLCENGTEREVKPVIAGTPVRKKYEWGDEVFKEVTPSRVLLYQQTCEEVWESDEEIKDIIESLREVVPQLNAEIFVLGNGMMLEAFGDIISVPRKDSTGKKTEIGKYLANKMRVL